MTENFLLYRLSKSDFDRRWGNEKTDILANLLGASRAKKRYGSGMKPRRKRETDSISIPGRISRHSGRAAHVPLTARQNCPDGQRYPVPSGGNPGGTSGSQHRHVVVPPQPLGDVPTVAS